MLALCFLFLTSASVPHAPEDTLRVDTLRREQVAGDTLRVDTLSEVTVEGGDLQVNEVLGRTTGAIGKSMPKDMSLGAILEKLSPGINDKITHPFAIKQRKMERRRKRAKKILEQFDRVKTFDDLLRESIERQELEEKRGKKR